jgi:hypothetical protein
MLSPENYLQELELALKEYRFQDISTLAEKIDPATFSPTQVKTTLSLLRRKRRFKELEHVAGQFCLAGHNDLLIRRQWTQAILDQNKLEQGIRELEGLAQKHDTTEKESHEIRGLLGRAYKQLYVNEGGADNLRNAITAYKQDWKSKLGDTRWRGINLVALISRARRDGIPLRDRLDPAKMAGDLLETIKHKKAADAWDYATALEAAVALDDEQTALGYTQKYLAHTDADAFEISSTLRQLKEIWQIEGKSIGNSILPVLEYALLQRDGSKVELRSIGDSTRSSTGFEAVWGQEGVIYMQWLDTMYSRCNAIARISDNSTGAPKGTGFLVTGSKLKPAWGDAPVFVTNSHVISRQPHDQAPLIPEEALVEFTRIPNRPKVALGELLYSSPRSELDVSILRIEAPQGSSSIDPFPHLPVINTENSDEQRIYVIGHPSGNEMAVSLYDNSLTEYERQYVRYRSPTEEGNSGSPVFTKKLHAIAVHHRALKDKKLNEGVLLNEIKASLQQP